MNGQHAAFFQSVVPQNIGKLQSAPVASPIKKPTSILITGVEAPTAANALLLT